MFRYLKINFFPSKIPTNQQVREHFEAEKNYHTWSQLPGEEKDSKPTERTQTYQEKQAEELQKINYAEKVVNAETIGRKSISGTLVI